MNFKPRPKTAPMRMNTSAWGPTSIQSTSLRAIALR